MKWEEILAKIKSDPEVNTMSCKAWRAKHKISLKVWYRYKPQGWNWTSEVYNSRLGRPRTASIVPSKKVLDNDKPTYKKVPLDEYLEPSEPIEPPNGVIAAFVGKPNDVAAMVKRFLNHE